MENSVVLHNVFTGEKNRQYLYILKTNGCETTGQLQNAFENPFYQMLILWLVISIPLFFFLKDRPYWATLINIFGFILNGLLGNCKLSTLFQNFNFCVFLFEWYFDNWFLMSKKSILHAWSCKMGMRIFENLMLE